MIRRPPRSTRTYTLFPYTTRFRSVVGGGHGEGGLHRARQGRGFVQRPVGVAIVVGVADARALDQQHVAIGVARQRLDREAGHRFQVRLAFRPAIAVVLRSEERRRGKECVSTCSSWWSTSH